MRHRVAGRKLGRNTPHRKSMFRNMAVSLLTHGQITTTLPKAKSVKPLVEKLISAAKKGDLASRRRVISMLGNDRIMVRSEEDESLTRNKYGELVGGPKVVKTLFDEIAPRYADRDGGYTRIVRLDRHRIGDGTQLCVLQLVGDEEGPQVSGSYSRRRDKANKRMEFAASLRKGGKADEAAEEAKPEAATEVAEAPAEEAPAAEAEKTEEEKS
ncbi:50S ribosomal protein L17 [Mucisphaera sp.]|uniref:50S ribosomal protein L17 n=1 Tax=Mucisphaera sp. TaxID=2913024 RepID=UPI003D0E6FF5